MHFTRLSKPDSFKPLASSPRWFLENICNPGTSVFTHVAHRQVHMLAWNWECTELPALMLVHGFAANAHWWSFLAPFFADRFRVVALDLPGMGDSEAPATYQDDCFARAIVGCIEAHRLQPVCIIGHSFGGAQSIRAIGMSPHLFSRAIIVDSNVRLAPEPLIRRLQPKGSHKTSRSRAECAARLRLMPPQPNYIDALVHYIGFHSCIEGDDGWHWKSDPNCLNTGEIEDPEILRCANTRVDMIYGEKSFLNVENKPERVLRHFPQSGRLEIIPHAGHHIMVDHPLELVATINALLID